MNSVQIAAGAIVDWCSVHARLVTLVALLTCGAAGLYAGLAFNIRTDLDALVSPSLAWRQNEARVEKLFPSLGDDITIVIDGPTPEQADLAAQRLTEKLSRDRSHFVEVSRPDGGLYLDQNGLLFLSTSEVAETTGKLVRGQPVLGAVAADPSLRGLATAFSLSLSDTQGGAPRVGELVRPAEMVAKLLADLRRGRTGVLAWSELALGAASESEDRRRIVRAAPRQDFSSVEPGASAEKAVRQATQALGLTPLNGYRVRLTGTVPMADDELATLRESIGPLGLLSLTMMLGILYAGLREVRLVASILVTVLCGLAVTAAGGLAWFGRFNLISVAFLPLFIGLGIDFAIQFAVRYRSLPTVSEDVKLRLAEVGRTASPGLLTAAGAAALGFVAFLPTSYRGVSELGLIAGLGMLVAVMLTLTLLPALIRLLQIDDLPPLPGRHQASQFPGERGPRKWLVAFACAATIAALISPNLHIDLDPLSLRSPKSESVSTFHDLASHAGTTPNTLDVLRPSLADATALAKRLSELPSVARATTLSEFVPADQAPKLALIRDANALLGPTVDPFDVAPPPSDEERLRALNDLDAALHGAAPARSEFSQLEREVAALIHARAADRLAAERALFASWPSFLNQLRTGLQAEPVALTTLPRAIVKDWVAANGAARIEVSPRGDSENPRTVARFVREVRRLAPSVSGNPVSVASAGQTILRAFVEAALLSSFAIVGLLFWVLRSPKAALLALAPVVLTLLFTLATCALIGQAINLENIIALPLLLGIGVSFSIYLMVNRRSGGAVEVGSGLGHAILFSGLTTATSFSTLALSSHPGTASLGRVLLIALGWTLVDTLAFQPALLAVLQSRSK